MTDITKAAMESIEARKHKAILEQAKFKWERAPVRTEWGEGMMELLIELSKDTTASVFVHIDDIQLYEAQFYTKDELDTIARRNAHIASLRVE